MDVVKPVDQVEEGERDRKDDSGPLVYGVDVREVRDLDFELRGPPPQATLLVAHRPVDGRSSVQVPAGHGLAVLYARTVVGEHGSPGVVEGAHHVWSAHLGGEVGQEDVAVSIDLKKENKRFNSNHFINQTSHQNLKVQSPNFTVIYDTSV